MKWVLVYFLFFVVQSCQQLDAEGEAKQKALWHNQNSALKLRQTSGSGEASSGKHGFKKKWQVPEYYFNLYLDTEEVKSETSCLNLRRP